MKNLVVAGQFANTPFISTPDFPWRRPKNRFIVFCHENNIGSHHGGSSLGKNAPLKKTWKVCFSPSFVTV
jgi:hypothetical protein